MGVAYNDAHLPFNMCTLEDLVSQHCFYHSCIVFDDCLSSVIEIWTYSEVLGISAVTSRVLRECISTKLVCNKPVVAVYARLCPVILSVIISILSIPAVYCPINLNLPSNLKWNMILSSCVSIIIVHISLLEEFLSMASLMLNCTAVLTHLLQYGIVVFTFQQDYQMNYPSNADKANDDNSKYNSRDSSSIAYILHTSGSTGIPKKVSVPHCCIVPNITDLKKRFTITPEDRIFNSSPLTFDPSIVEMFLSLSSGSCLVVVPDTVKAIPSLLSQILVQRHRITVLQITPSVFAQLSENTVCNDLLGEYSSLRVLAFGGEICPGLKSLMKWKSKKNMTRIFNIYGITEVSCWATCHEVTPITTNNSAVGDIIPIGERLMDTCVKLRDQTETDNGIEGTLWIGGYNRVCLVGKESELCLDTACMRNTGDIAFKENCTGHVYIIGRIDRQIKRKGHCVNLDYVQQVISSQLMVFLCAVLTNTSHDTSHDETVLVAAIVSNTDEFNLKNLFKDLNKLLPGSHIPDRFVFVDSIPTNPHGKCDFNALRDMLNSQDNIHQLSVFVNDRADIVSLLLEVTETVLSDERVNNDYWEKQSLLELGANSFDVVRIINLLEQRLTISSSKTVDWFEPLLTRPLAEVTDIICNSLTVGLQLIDRNCKRGLSYGSMDATHKIPKLSSEDCGKSITTYRRGMIAVNGRHVAQSLCSSQRQLPHLSLHKLWTVPTGKCVDSSPLVVSNMDSIESPVVFIGSHSGLLFAIQLKDGAINWKTQLPDRLESSPCLSICGCYVIIGCYNGCVYTVNSTSGNIEWCCETDGSTSGDPIKSSPIVHPSTGLVWFGSHDKHVYCIDIYSRRVIHKVFLDGGSCFSSPSLSLEASSLFIGTLKGNMFSIDMSGHILWCYSCSKPIFSSPTVLPTGNIAFGCVGGLIHIVNTFGQQVQILETNEAVFSTCLALTTLTSLNCLYVGSHDSHMYCWESVVDHKYQLKWKCKLDSPIYSTCMYSTFKLPKANYHLTQSSSSHSGVSSDTNNKPIASSYKDNIGLLCVCSCKGCLYIVNPLDGSVVNCIELPGEIFSSPVIINDMIVVGCRDELVHCAQIC